MANISSSAVIALLLLSVIYFLENYDRNLISVAPIPYIDTSSYSYSLLSGPMFTIAYTLTGLVISLNFDSTASSKVTYITAACVIFSTATLCTALATTFWQQCLLRMAMGLGQSIITPFSSSVISSHFTTSQRGSAFSIFNFGAYLSYSMVLSLGTFMLDEYGWQSGYLLFGVLGIAVAVITAVFLREGHVQDDAEEVTLYDVLAVDDKSSAASDENNPPGDEVAFRRCLRVINSVLVMWRRHPSLIVLAAATGVRIGAGYVWTAYTAYYFSPKYESDDSSCDYTWSGVSGAPEGSGGSCSRDYPYCVSGECSSLTDYPWHNTGMSHERLISYMSWVPLVGSGFGSIVGGVATDWLVKLFPFLKFLARPLVASGSSLTSIPFVVMALISAYPDCFLYFIASGLVGEMYIGASLAFVVDICDVPELALPSMALFMFVITLIGGNAPLLVPLVSSLIPQQDYTFTISAAPTSPEAGGNVKFQETQVSGDHLLDTLLWVQCSLYALSALMYISAAVMIARRASNIGSFSR